MAFKFISVLILGILFIGMGVSDTPAPLPLSDSSASLPSVVEVLPADESGLHREILKSFDELDFHRASVLLDNLKSKYPQRYSAFPYMLLHAKVLALSGKPGVAYPLYRTLGNHPTWGRFVKLSLARTAAADNRREEAVAHYQEFLRTADSKDLYHVAVESLEYCTREKDADSLLETARIVQKKSAAHRLGQFYVAKSYMLRKENQQARSLLLTLLHGRVDDITNQALMDLDSIDGDELSEKDRIWRAQIANQVWNFELVRKYLQPIVDKDMEHSYYYARASYFIGETEMARSIYRKALDTWPNDPMYRKVLAQYANASLRDGDFDEARRRYEILHAESRSQQEWVSYKLVNALRAQNRYEEALKVLEPYCRSRNSAIRARALYVRSRVYVQAGRLKEALRDIEPVSKMKTGNQKEALLWKGIVLEKMKRTSDALAVYRKLAEGHDFYSLLAMERLSSLGSHRVFQAARTYGDLTIPQLPGENHEAEILDRLQEGDALASLLYLHLYEEAADVLPAIDPDTYGMLGVDGTSKLQRFLTIARLAALGNDFSTATYYAELFINNLPRNFPLFTLPVDILKVLYPLPYEEQVARFTTARGVDPFMVLAIMRQESKFKRFARSPAFARGLMQLIPSTASKMAGMVGISDFRVEQLYLPETNINLGTRYMEEMIREFGDRVEIIAAGYNGGEAAVRSWLASSSADQIMDFFSNIDMSETRKYVMIVKMNYELYKYIYGTKQVAGLPQ